MAAAARLAALMLALPAVSGKAYSRFLFIPLRLRGDAPDELTMNMVQLAEFQLFSNHDQVDLRQSSAHSPNEVAGGAETGASAVDQVLSTKWLDPACPTGANADRTGCALSITVSTSVEADSFSFITAVTGDPSNPDDPELKRDPVAFELQGFDASGAMTVLYKSSTDYDTPRGRNAQCATFTFGSSGPSGGGGGGGGGSDGCGGGCIFLILFFVGGFTYFAAGVAINRYKFEKRGFESIPNVEFWKDVPFLVKDGVLYTVHKVRGGSGGYASV
eukprot:TRINITY_DN4844_c0_g2_i1.p1 TRINITY_DN4844_c0_g2~~TRINITY_DN4844_c0_g2_i1.p1  ORF type:complete len:300 (+),score=124.79 TRINITY_DN4844_c0_g2_i1:80-901(+)